MIVLTAGDHSPTNCGGQSQLAHKVARPPRQRAPSRCSSRTAPGGRPCCRTQQSVPPRCTEFRRRRSCMRVSSSSMDATVHVHRVNVRVERDVVVVVLRRQKVAPRRQRLEGVAESIQERARRLGLPRVAHTVVRRDEILFRGRQELVRVPARRLIERVDCRDDVVVLLLAEFGRECCHDVDGATDIVQVRVPQDRATSARVVKAGSMV